MSATLGTFLHELDWSLKIGIFERLDEIAKESSDAMNNAGTGHSAFCELNYTPENDDGSIDISKAIGIVESFEVSKQFWAYLTEKKYFNTPGSFINTIPHSSLVFGEKDVKFLKARHAAMEKSNLFQGMEYSEDHRIINQWMPLIMKNRNPSHPIAATRMSIGTDIDFGSLTRQLISHLTSSSNVSLHINHEVKNLSQDAEKMRHITVRDTKTWKNKELQTPFVFIGAGGGALPLLQKSGIKERKWFGGFPVSGQWLICNNPNIIAQHEAKVYGKAGLGTPPMSVPHLDTRIINGKKALLFWPYAWFTTKFLKTWSFLDLPLSIHYDNIRSMLWAGAHNWALTKYLIDQVIQSPKDRLEALREYVVDAKMEDWDLKEAGYRVQIIKADAKEWGKLQFWTEVVVAQDGSLATLLGASPWASTSVSIMLDLLKKAFPQKINSSQWESKLQEMIPSYGKKLSGDVELTKKVREWSHKILELE